MPRRPLTTSVRAILIGCLLALAAPGQIQVPPNDGWVTDLAGLLTSAQQQELETLMESYRAGTTHEIALLTVPDLGGESIEGFSLEVARVWKIGRESENNGALLVVSRDDRKIRIEVGRGLEGALPDSVAGRIIRNVIAPEFKGGQFYQGIRNGIAAIHAAIGGDYGQIPDQAPRSGSSFGPLLLLLMLVMVTLGIIASRGGRGRGLAGGHRGSSWPWWLLAGTIAGSAGRRGGGQGGGFGGGGFGGRGFGGFGGGGGFSGGGASGGW